MRRPRLLATRSPGPHRRRAMRRRSPAAAFGATAALACLALVVRLVRRGEAAVLAPPTFAGPTIP